MAKLERGRFVAMMGNTSEELNSLADEYLARADDPNDADDPKWLARRATKIRRLAQQKERSLEHKLGQKG